jgi:hypothetical protein
MPHKELTTWNWVVTLLYAAFAGFGGAMGYVMRSLHANEKVLLWRVVAEGSAAGFVGVIMLFLCQAMGLSAEWTGVVVGVGGWMGATSSIRMLEGVVSRKLGSKGDTNGPFVGDEVRNERPEG